MPLLLAPFLMALASAATQKILVALGFGITVFTGFQLLKGQLESAIDSALGNLSGDVFSLICLAGFIDVLGIWLGAWTVVGTLAVTKRIGIL